MMLDRSQNLRVFQSSWFAPAVLLLLAAILIVTLPIELVILLAVGTLGAFLLLRWPWLIWLAIASLLPITSGIKAGPLSATDGLLLAAILLWFADGVRRRTLRLHGSPILFWLALYIASLLLSLWSARDFVEGSAEVVKWAEFGLVIVLVRAMLPPKHAPWLVIALLTAAVTQAIIGLYQFTFQVGPAWFIIFGRFMRASGTFAQPNPYAGYLGLTLPVAVSLFLWAASEWWSKPVIADFVPKTLLPAFGLRPRFWVYIAGASTLLIGMGLMLSWSRGGWLGGIAGLGVVLFLRSRRTVLAGGFAALALLLLLLLGSLGPELVPQAVAARAEGVTRYVGFNSSSGQSILNEPVTDENFAILERVAHWVVAIRMWEENPWLGVGPGNYATVYPEIIQADARLGRWEEPLGHAHNIYLNVLAEGGLVGISTYLLFWLGIIAWVWRRRQEAGQKSFGSALALGVLGAVTHLSVHNLVDNLFVQGMYIHIGLWFAILHFPTCTYPAYKEHEAQLLKDKILQGESS